MGELTREKCCQEKPKKMLMQFMDKYKVTKQSCEGERGLYTQAKIDAYCYKLIERSGDKNKGNVNLLESRSSASTSGDKGLDLTKEKCCEKSPKEMLITVKGDRNDKEKVTEQSCQGADPPKRTQQQIDEYCSSKPTAVVTNGAVASTTLSSASIVAVLAFVLLMQ